MSALLRVSRIRDPRSTRASSVLTFVAFALFGVWAEVCIALDTTRQASILPSQQDPVLCLGHPEAATASPINRELKEPNSIVRV
jgi:hypothetical protein